MGLLEDAIREHLELQRRGGVDPYVVARAEQEALEPLVPGQTPAWAEGPIPFDYEDPSAAAAAVSVPGSSAGERAPQFSSDGAPAVRRGAYAGASLLEQETAELDMSTILGETSARLDAGTPLSSGVPEFGPVRARRIAPQSPEGEFEWEGPERSTERSVPDAPARRGSFIFE
jgi:hypothetical protein